MVTPLAGVWIEIFNAGVCYGAALVTPLAGVWIEMLADKDILIPGTVTPLAGVWIEIKIVAGRSEKTLGHSPRGSVD